MPTFTITKDGQTLNTVTLEGERIELGSANTCKLFIDDLLISLHQAAFLKTSDGYDIEPIARTPSFTMNGEKVSERTALVPGAVIEVEGYRIQVDAGAIRAGGGQVSAPAVEPSLPEPLDLTPEPPPPIPPPPPPPPPPPLEIPKAQPAEAPKPLPPLPPIDEPIPEPARAAPPKEQSQPPLPPPLPPIPEPLFAEDSPAQAPPPPVKSSALPPLPPLPPPTPAPKPRPSAEAATQYSAPVKPIGKLMATAGPLKGKTWPLAGTEIKIGREQGQNDILVRFDAKGEIDTSISRRHASIHIDGNYAFVEDQGSMAGTYVNGRQAAKGQRVPLRSGDEIEIRSAKESTVFRVELGESPAQAAPSPLPPPIPEPSYAPPPPSPAPTPRYAPPPEPSRPEARREDSEPPRERKPIRRSERRPALDEDNPFAPVKAEGIPQWVWFAIGGAVVVIVLILVFVFI